VTGKLGLLRPALPVVLASSSPQRRELLGRIVESFSVMCPTVDEGVKTSAPVEFVKRAARMKAAEVARKLTGPAIVIGADTIVACKGGIIGKPDSMESAVETLLFISRNPHSVVTGLCVLGPGIQILDAVETKIRMRPMSRDDAGEYAAQVGSLERSGAYALKEHGDEFVERLEGSVSNVIGLPLERLSEILISIPGTARE